MEKASTHSDASKTIFQHFRGKPSCQRTERYFFNGLQIQLRKNWPHHTFHIQKYVSRVTFNSAVLHAQCCSTQGRCRGNHYNSHTRCAVLPSIEEVLCYELLFTRERDENQIWCVHIGEYMLLGVIVGPDYYGPPYYIKFHKYTVLLYCAKNSVLQW